MPKLIDLQNCTTLTEALTELDHQYGNATNISATFIKEFLDLKFKAKSPQSKVVEIKTAVFQLFTDLKAVKQEESLTKTPFIMNSVHKMLPPTWQDKYSEQKAGLIAAYHDDWGAMSHFLKAEADWINRDTPWLLDSRKGG